MSAGRHRTRLSRFLTMAVSRSMSVAARLPGATFPGVLHGVSATSATSAWAVGFYTAASGQPRTLIMHWTGTRWSQS